MRTVFKRQRHSGVGLFLLFVFLVALINLFVSDA